MLESKFKSKPITTKGKAPAKSPSPIGMIQTINPKFVVPLNFSHRCTKYKKMNWALEIFYGSSVDSNHHILFKFIAP